MSAVLGLMGRKQDNQGVWHRVCLNTIVRKGVKLDSERLRILPMGSKVLIVEQQDRRVRIAQPLPGWCSLRSSNGDTILTPLHNKEDFSNEPSSLKRRKEEQSAQYAQKQAELANIDQHAVPNEVQGISKEIEKLRGQINQVSSNKTTLLDKMITLKDMKDECAKLDAKVDAKNKTLAELHQQEKMLAEKMTAIEGGEARLAELNRREQLRAEVAELEEKMKLYDKMLEAAEREKAEVRQKYQQYLMDSTNPKQKEKNAIGRLRPEDVVMLRGDAGIVIVKWVGKLPGREEEGRFVGVELSGPQGDTDGNFNGEQLFKTRPNWGQFFPVSSIKHKIRAEQLLQQLHKVIRKMNREQTSKE